MGSFEEGYSKVDRGPEMNLLAVFLIAFLAFTLVVIGMSVGVILGGKKITGSCGGLGTSNRAGEPSSCSLCSNSGPTCPELTRRMRGRNSATKPPVAEECDLDPSDQGFSKENRSGCGVTHSPETVQ